MLFLQASRWQKLTVKITGQMDVELLLLAFYLPPRGVIEVALNLKATTYSLGYIPHARQLYLLVTRVLWSRLNFREILWNQAMSAG